MRTQDGGAAPQAGGFCHRWSAVCRGRPELVVYQPAVKLYMSTQAAGALALQALHQASQVLQGVIV